MKLTIVLISTCILIAQYSLASHHVCDTDQEESQYLCRRQHYINLKEIGARVVKENSMFKWYKAENVFTYGFDVRRTDGVNLVIGTNYFLMEGTGHAFTIDLGHIYYNLQHLCSYFGKRTKNYA